MKRVIIVHGRTANPEKHWFPAEKKILEERGYQVSIPRLSDDVRPKLNDWLAVLEKEKLDESTLLIGHSLGTVAVLRLLEKIDIKVGKVILLAAYFRDIRENYEGHDFIKDPFNWEKIKASAKEIIILNEENDPCVRLELGREVAEKTGANLIVLKGESHMHEIDLDIINSRL